MGHGIKRLVGWLVYIISYNKRLGCLDDEEETWWWRVNREDVQNSIIEGPKTGQGQPTESRYQFEPGLGYDYLPRGRGSYFSKRRGETSSPESSTSSSDSLYSGSVSDDALLIDMSD